MPAAAPLQPLADTGWIGGVGGKRKFPVPRHLP